MPPPKMFNTFLSKSQPPEKDDDDVSDASAAKPQSSSTPLSSVFGVRSTTQNPADGMTPPSKPAFPECGMGPDSHYENGKCTICGKKASQHTTFGR